ncbi:MAG: hypothetical protein MZU97_16465 [Bacillus subtilis]|nr:hypothetical protein [Bacillus subtilis]
MLIDTLSILLTYGVTILTLHFSVATFDARQASMLLSIVVGHENRFLLLLETIQAWSWTTSASTRSFGYSSPSP